MAATTTTFDTVPALSVPLRRKLDDLLVLEANWDGENAKPVKPHVVAEVAETLRRLSGQIDDFCEPFLAPTFDGFVQLEWRKKMRSLDIEATEKGWSAVGTEVVPDGWREYHTAEFERDDFARLTKFYQWLAGNELTWPSL